MQIKSLLQSATTCYYKVRQLNLLQSAATCYYKVRQLFYYKVRQNTPPSPGQHLLHTVPLSTSQY